MLRKTKPSRVRFLIEAVERLEKQGRSKYQENQTERYAALIRLCGECQDLQQGKRIHASLDRTGYRGDRFLSNLLVQMYGKCGSIQDARLVFQGMARRNKFSWAIIMAAYAQNGLGWEVLDLFHEMDLDGVRPDTVNFINVLMGCSLVGALSKGRAFHSRLRSLGMTQDIILSCALITMYGRCGAVGDAKSVFTSMPEKDIVTWNAMLAAYAQNGYCVEAMELYRELGRLGIAADNITYITVLYACSCLEDLEQGMKIHTILTPGMVDSDVVLANALVTMYFKCQRLDLAEAIFERMPHKTDASWNVIITANTQCGEARNALHLYRRMNHEGVQPGEITFMSVLDACCLLKELGEGRRVHELIAAGGLDGQVIMGTNLVNMYGKCGSASEAKFVFDKLVTKTLVTWTAMIAAYTQNGYGREALDLFYEMDEVEKPKLDNVALITLVDACTKLGDLSEGRKAHSRIIEHKLDGDLIVCNSLITMYNKCGSLAASKSIFDGLKNPNVVSWNAMLAAYCEHGLNEAAVDQFAGMLNDGIPPDDVTFVSILFACSHAGLFEQGWENFFSMQRDFNVTCKFEHYICMADLLGRAGRLDEAEVLLEGIPSRNTATAWNTLLSACKLHQNVEKGERIAERIFDLDPKSAGSYVLLSSMYSAVGRFADAARVRRRMEENCGMKTRTFRT